MTHLKCNRPMRIPFMCKYFLVFVVVFDEGQQWFSCLILVSKKITKQNNILKFQFVETDKITKNKTICST